MKRLFRCKELVINSQLKDIVTHVYKIDEFKDAYNMVKVNKLKY